MAWKRSSGRACCQGTTPTTLCAAAAREEDRPMPSALFQPIALRGLELPNRIVIAPMCQYSADNGSATDWHMIHLGGYALSGAGLLIVEATGVSPEGRITPEIGRAHV